MGRAVHPPFSVDAAILIALGFAACMPAEVEVGRDATLGATANVGGDSPRARVGVDAGEAGMDGGMAGEGRVTDGGRVHSQGGAATLPAGNGGVAGTSASATGGSAGAGSTAGFAGVGAGPTGSAGGSVVGSGGNGGTSATEFSCPADGSQVEAQWTLSMFCAAFDCPTSPDGAKDSLSRSFQGCPGLHNEVRTGCGLSQISVTTERQSDAYVFTDDTAELVGAAIHSDVPWGPCNVLRYVAGIMPRGCQSATACAFCGPLATCP